MYRDSDSTMSEELGSEITGIGLLSSLRRDRGKPPAAQHRPSRVTLTPLSPARLIKKIPSFLWSSSTPLPSRALGTSLLPPKRSEEEQRSRDGPRPARAPGPPHPPLLLRRRHPLRASSAGGPRARQGSPRFSARRRLRRRRFRTRGLY